MARKKSKKPEQETSSSEPKPETRATIKYPSLHQDVANAVSDQIPSTWFKKKDKGFEEEYSTKVMGKFKCNNGGCSKDGWASRTVAIVIRRYPNNGYNATVFNQRCQSCNKLGTLTLNENSYIERVAYRLKKWAGVPMETRPYDGSGGPPHISELCEGCKRGYCQEAFRRRPIHGPYGV
ncbi:zinc-binding domain-containing protein [Durotheca rogersii]|uniref:zinc-binding domain-containing protein n=1 Tax=Durotheca rogersii TaxID=419775 RepID=UPI002220E57E|nr:zinc-binding domain-containing protein [Durotheca rogersii]KAI5865706.1 zinc-binding domain-containing protein [Durotheca rogersii]